MIQLECLNVSMAYERNTVIQNISFQAEAGDFITILGKNGAGKSTLVKGILGLLPIREGQVFLKNGLENQIGYLPQQNQVQKDFPASVTEVILSGFLSKVGFFPFYRKKEKKIALDHMERLGIMDLRKKSFRKLSGGQQQRVLLARALCATNSMIVLDEPISGLDPMVTADFYHLLEELNREDGISILMVSHDVQSAIKYSNKILHLKDHVFFGKEEDYIKSMDSQDFLGGCVHD